MNLYIRIWIVIPFKEAHLMHFQASNPEMELRPFLQMFSKVFPQMEVLSLALVENFNYLISNSLPGKFDNPSQVASWYTQEYEVRKKINQQIF
jgi:hypothetical protein